MESTEIRRVGKIACRVDADCDGARAILPTRSALPRVRTAWANAREFALHHRHGRRVCPPYRPHPGRPL